jgi:hypothetical protein
MSHIGVAVTILQGCIVGRERQSHGSRDACQAQKESRHGVVSVEDPDIRA